MPHVFAVEALGQSIRYHADGNAVKVRTEYTQRRVEPLTEGCITPKTMVIGTKVKKGNSSTEVKLLSASDTAAGHMRSMRQPPCCGVPGCGSYPNPSDGIGSSDMPAYHSQICRNETAHHSRIP